MHVSALLLLLGTYSLVHALTVPGTSPWPDKHLESGLRIAKRSVPYEIAPRALCPQVWWTIATELKLSFLGVGGCNNLARQAIRAAFHDCFVDGCNGSLMLSGECDRSENNGLEDICAQLPTVRAKYGVGMADLIQFAGAIAVEVCPLGPPMPFYAGRKDSTTPSTPGQLPSVTGSGDQLFNMFKAKGFTATDLAALIGAHTTSEQFFVNKAKAGAAQDTTPNVWDVAYYGQMLAGTAPFTFESDKNLAAQNDVKGPFKGFVGNQVAWNGAFVVA
ncbi:heme peroxidase [Mytilinidion resinicola]|uniref:Peroxidase n=1 Tax=Mytilinidion resinicola TaxID=574789 RepID=A0A6A6Y599_9PEZI|nr:heme peroxidase [Mytilinidion resinicola]KAF2803698.1 heme peroxidase [Mytilinidion resinicola]